MPLARAGCRAGWSHIAPLVGLTVVEMQIVHQSAVLPCVNLEAVSPRCPHRRVIHATCGCRAGWGHFDPPVRRRLHGRKKDRGSDNSSRSCHGPGTCVGRLEIEPMAGKYCAPGHFNLQKKPSAPTRYHPRHSEKECIISLKFN